MGLKGYMLWVMGQLDSTCRAPPRNSCPTQTAAPTPSNARGVAVHKLHLKRHILKPGWIWDGMFKGKDLKPVAFNKLWVNVVQLV
jgi:hypothetical protein